MVSRAGAISLHDVESEQCMLNRKAIPLPI
ncbi:hypothetical protein AF72_00855 [Xylella taiwanensis]|uniref:Uncharacterized protein n=1 Tax=Xylella taiwanensis TaxID=1444770 RepID=Z9JM21_9GAMM|nr:hypothetical protein AF72_00855 [Xylella taiwanensis]